jgi:hypothetical protein
VQSHRNVQSASTIPSVVAEAMNSIKRLFCETRDLAGEMMV